MGAVGSLSPEERKKITREAFVVCKGFSSYMFKGHEYTRAAERGEKSQKPRRNVYDIPARGN